MALDYRAVFDSAPDGIVVVDDKGLIIEVNSSAVGAVRIRPRGVGR